MKPITRKMHHALKHLCRHRRGFDSEGLDKFVDRVLMLLQKGGLRTDLKKGVVYLWGNPHVPEMSLRVLHVGPISQGFRPTVSTSRINEFYRKNSHVKTEYLNTLMELLENHLTCSWMFQYHKKMPASQRFSVFPGSNS